MIRKRSLVTNPVEDEILKEVLSTIKPPTVIDDNPQTLLIEH
jgi:hypothetical protein